MNLIIKKSNQKKKLDNKKILLTKHFSSKTYKTKTTGIKFKTNTKKNQNLQNKLLNILTRSGKKHKSERTLIKSFKASQKYGKKTHEKLFKLSILNSIPTFKIVKLTNKKRRKKSTKEIPTFVSNYSSRVSLGLKYIVKAAINSQNEHNTFFKKLKNELLLGATTENVAITTKNNFQTKALQEKKYFRFYRW